MFMSTAGHWHLYRRIAPRLRRCHFCNNNPLVCLPQVAETNTPQTQDAPGECSSYYKSMTRVFISDAKPEERYALRLLLLDLNMDVVGEAADWFTTLTHAPATRLDMLLVEWDLLPKKKVFRHWQNYAWPVRMRSS